MTLILGIFCLLNSFSLSASATDSTESFDDRIKVIESQADITCTKSSSGADPVRVQIAEHVLSNNGTAAALMKAVSDRAQVVNSALENARSAVVDLTAPKLESKKSEAQMKLDAALKRLHEQDAGNVERTPASAASDQLRDEVRRAYANFQIAGHIDPNSAEFKKDVDTYRDARTTELKTLATLGQRLGTAVQKISACHCSRTNGPECKDREALETDAKWYRALDDSQTAQNKAYGINTYKTTASAAVSAK